MMKKLLLLLVFIPSLLPAQDIYSDMLADGKTWSFIRFPNGNTHCMGMRGDTIVNGMECRKYGYVNDDGAFSCTSVFRQEGDKVYVKYHNRQDFSLAYDFGVSVGDTMEMELDWARIVVTGKDVVTARGHEMRRVSYKVTEYYDGIEWRPLEDNYGSWIEGIGGSSGPESHIPVPGFGGNYYMMTDISLGDEVLCDAYIFTGQDPEKMMLTFKPEWTYTKQLWDEVEGEWGEPVEGHAMKTGLEIPSPWFFPYTTINIEEEQQCKLLLRNGDRGQVLAEKASYLEYMSKAFPGMEDVFTELAYYPLDVVLYDFSLNVGDRYPCRGEVTVEGISEMTTRDGVSRKLFHLSNGLLLLEGVGCLNSRYGVFGYQNDPGTDEGGMAAQSPQSEEPADGAILSFLKYGENTAPVYLQGDWEMGIAKVAEQKQADGVIYDLQGRKVGTSPSAQLKKGIYIIGGKKAIIK